MKSRSSKFHHSGLEGLIISFSRHMIQSDLISGFYGNLVPHLEAGTWRRISWHFRDGASGVGFVPVALAGRHQPHNADRAEGASFAAAKLWCSPPWGPAGPILQQVSDQ